MGDRPTFLTLYNTVEVPEPLVMMDAADERASYEEARFFQRVSRSLQLSHFALESFFQTNVRMLVPAQGHTFARGDRRESDDVLHELWADDIQPLATVLRVRDGRSSHVAVFSKFPLLPRTIEVVREMHAIDEIIAPTTD